jgi:hypothetical protein
MKFVFCDVFTFTGDAISRLETYHVALARSGSGFATGARLGK